MANLAAVSVAPSTREKGMPTRRVRCKRTRRARLSQARAGLEVRGRVIAAGTIGSAGRSNASRCRAERRLNTLRAPRPGGVKAAFKAEKQQEIRDIAHGTFLRRTGNLSAISALRASRHSTAAPASLFLPWHAGAVRDRDSGMFVRPVLARPTHAARGADAVAATPQTPHFK